MKGIFITTIVIMAVVCLPLLISFIVSLVKGKEEWSDWNEARTPLGVIFTTMFVATSLFMGLSGGTAKYTSEQFNIYSLKTGTEASGSFTMGSGRVETTEYFYVFIDSKEGGYVRKRFAADTTTLKFIDPGKQPYAVVESKEWVVGTVATLYIPPVVFEYNVY